MLDLLGYGNCICISKVTKFKANNNFKTEGKIETELYLHKQSY